MNNHKNNEELIENSLRLLKRLLKNSDICNYILSNNIHKNLN